MIRTCCAVLALSLCCAALDQGRATYVGGTLDAKFRTAGQLKFSEPKTVSYEGTNLRLAIPYEQIVSYRYCRQVSRHLGILPAIAVALVKPRQHRHVFTIVYFDEQRRKQVAIFEVPKQAAGTVKAILDAKGVTSCIEYQPCGPK